jgi:hypothetical protein
MDTNKKKQFVEMVCKFPNISHGAVMKSPCIESNATKPSKTLYNLSSSEGYCSFDLNSENLSLSSSENVSDGKYKYPPISIYDNLNKYANDRDKSSTEHLYDIVTPVVTNDECPSTFPIDHDLRQEQIYANLDVPETSNESKMLIELLRSLSIDIGETKAFKCHKHLSVSSSSLDEEICQINYPNQTKRKYRRHKRKELRIANDELSSDSLDETDDVNKRLLRTRRRIISNSHGTSNLQTNKSKFHDETFINYGKFPFT